MHGVLPSRSSHRGPWAGRQPFAAPDPQPPIDGAPADVSCREPGGTQVSRRQAQEGRLSRSVSSSRVEMPSFPYTWLMWLPTVRIETPRLLAHRPLRRAPSRHECDLLLVVAPGRPTWALSGDRLDERRESGSAVREPGRRPRGRFASAVRASLGRPPLGTVPAAASAVSNGIDTEANLSATSRRPSRSSSASVWM